MTTIAHLSDLHLLEEGHERRAPAARARLHFLSFGRPAHAARRKHRALRALQQARDACADHVVLTGDLTEDGHDAQFEVLAEVLAESRLDPSRVTLLPGNHDAYIDGDAFARALGGPLRPFSPTSAPGTAIRLRGSVLLALSSSVHQSPARSAGAIARRELDLAEAHARATRRRGDALVLAVHHSPRPHALMPLQWLDGLREHAVLGRLLLEHDHAHVIHGHTHARVDEPVRGGGAPRIFSVESVVAGRSPLRFYGVRHGRVWAEPEPRVAGVPNFALTL